LDKKLRVCFISPHSYPLFSNDVHHQTAGGAEAQFTTIGAALTNYGIDVHFIVDDFGQADTLKMNSIFIHRVSMKYFGGSKWKLLFEWINLFRCLKKIDADIHLLKIPKDLLIPIGIYCKLYKKKLILVGQSDKDVDIRLLLRLQNKIAVSLYRIGLCFVDSAIAQTSVQLKGFEKMNISSKLIRNVITLPFDKQIHKKKTILWVGNGTPNKQPDLFVNLTRKFPEYIFKMILADGKLNNLDEKYRTIEKEITNFEYLGFVPFSKIHFFFGQANLLINTSIREGFPNIFLQAWQFETPVISLCVDPDNVISNRGLGRVSGNIENMCKDIREITEDNELRQEMGINARRYIIEKHSLGVIVPQYVKLFDDLILNKI